MKSSLITRITLFVFGLLGLTGCSQTENLINIGTGLLGLGSMTRDGVRAMVGWFTMMSLVFALSMTPGCGIDQGIKAADAFVQNNVTPFGKACIDAGLVEQLVAQGSMQMINGRLVVRGTFKTGQFFEYEMGIGTDGTAAQISATTTGQQQLTGKVTPGQLQQYVDALRAKGIVVTDEKGILDKPATSQPAVKEPD